MSMVGFANPPLLIGTDFHCYVSGNVESHEKLPPIVRRKLFINAQSINYAGVLLVWDSDAAYYLMGGGNPNLRNSGLTSLYIWMSIIFAPTVTKRFNFDGFMIGSNERFFGNSLSIKHLILHSLIDLRVG